MKKILFMAASMAMCLAANGADDVTWLSNVYDFGAFDEDTKEKVAVFEMVNTTDEPVAIISATATCGCTVPKYSEEEVAPSDTARIVVSYDPSGRPGRFKKQVYVRTSASPERHKLTLQGTVIGSAETVTGRYPVSIGSLKLRTDGALFGKVYAGHEKMCYVDGYNQSADSIRPSVLSAPAYISVKSEPAVVAPGEMLTLAFCFTGEVDDLWGMVSDSVMIAPNPGEEAHAVPVVAIVTEDFSSLTPQERDTAPVARVEPERVMLGQVPVDAKSPVVSEIEVKNTGGRDLLLRRVYSADSGVSVLSSPQKVAKGQTGKIKISVDPSQMPSDMINTKLMIITNDPANPTISLRIVGERK